LRPGANAALSTGFIDAEAARIRTATVLLAQLEVDRDAVFRALSIARAAGQRTMLNPAPADAPVDEALLELADLITPNETEFAALCLRILGEHVVADGVAAMPSIDLHALCRRLHKGSVVITLGSAGCFVSHADATAFNDAAPSYRIAAIKANAIDTTGAGDAFQRRPRRRTRTRSDAAAGRRDPLRQRLCRRLHRAPRAPPSRCRPATTPRLAQRPSCCGNTTALPSLPGTIESFAAYRCSHPRRDRSWPSGACIRSGTDLTTTTTE
jgi:hypothetical protein